MITTNKWKIKFGGSTKEELLLLLSKKKIGLNAYAAQLFLDGNFTTTTSEKVAEIVEVSVKDLGYETGAFYNDILLSAEKYGLTLCPLELAPQFRVQYLTQEEGPYLTIASLKTRNDDNYPNGFYLRHYSNFFWLRGYQSSADWLWGPDQKFAFVEGYA